MDLNTIYIHAEHVKTRRIIYKYQSSFFYLLVLQKSIFCALGQAVGGTKHASCTAVLSGSYSAHPDGGDRLPTTLQL